MDSRVTVVRRYASAALIAVAVALGLVGLDEVTAAAPAAASTRAAPQAAPHRATGGAPALERRARVSSPR